MVNFKRVSDAVDVLQHINDLSGQIDLEELLVSSEALAQQLIECQNLPSYVSAILGDEDSINSDLSPYEKLAIAPEPQAKKVAPPRPTSSPTRTQATPENSPATLQVENY